jgi:RNA-directed DNA polymerase
MDLNNIYHKIYNIRNLILAWRRARKGKTKKEYVIEFEKNIGDNLRELKFELMSQTYKPKPLKTFILRDPKTRKISKSAFRDRIIHHALIRVIEPIFDKSFIYDSCANRIGKGNLFALRRFDLFKRKVTCNLRREAFCFKADIKHYFQEVNHEILMEIIRKKIKDEKVIGLIERILKNSVINKEECKKGMPLGNLTSQFFANVYLNELDYFIKHKLKIRYYLRYVDDFVILHNSQRQLEIWKLEIDKFLRVKLKIELHSQKSRIISLSRGVDFVGFRNFWYYRLLRKRNIKNILIKFEDFKNGNISKANFFEIFQGWNAYAKWADCYRIRKKYVMNFLIKTLLNKRYLYFL